VSEMRIRSGSVPTQQGMDAQRGDGLILGRLSAPLSKDRAVGNRHVAQRRAGEASAGAGCSAPTDRDGFCLDGRRVRAEVLC
jgi:hypothetical protein